MCNLLIVQVLDSQKYLLEEVSDLWFSQCFPSLV